MKSETFKYGQPFWNRDHRARRLLVRRADSVRVLLSAWSIFLSVMLVAMLVMLVITGESL